MKDVKIVMDMEIKHFIIALNVKKIIFYLQILKIKIIVKLNVIIIIIMITKTMRNVQKVIVVQVVIRN